MKIELKQMSLHKEAEADIWLEQTPNEMPAVASYGWLSPVLYIG